MRNSKVSQEEDKLIQQKLQEAFGYTDEQLAAQLDQAAAEYAAHPELNLTPPKGEFEKILAMAAQDETQDKKEDSHKVIRLKKAMKPMILVAAVGAILLGTGMMASGRRYYQFWGENRGKGEIVFNNVEAISEADSLEKAYEVIAERLGIQVIQLSYIPDGMEYEGVVVEQSAACIDLRYRNKKIYFHQITNENANSTGYNSDREPYREIYNRPLQKSIKIYKNVLEDNQIELNAYWTDGNAFYYLDGVIEEEIFDKIVKNMNYY